MEVLRFHLRYTPATIIIDYRSKDEQEERRKVLEFQNFQNENDIDLLARLVLNRCSDLFEGKASLQAQLVSLIKRLKNPSLPLDYSKIDLNVYDLSKLTKEQIDTVKTLMDDTFKKNRITKNDKGFVYDKKVDFDSIPKEASDWDD
ncbi:putative CEP19-like protein [Blattamonas nauphoetae]|uniref:Centrosomal protein of 19 kDa n=1 Tax=Blattamonas nauphoetae TaxID=2049346 RepID=A0ABQ9XVQ5_9EUKA|nr:putative CEP19-like protein [Blattamonas nauphoetae]